MFLDRKSEANHSSLYPPHFRRGFLRATEYVLMLIGLGAVGYYSIVVWSAKVQQTATAREFNHALQSKPVEPERADGAAIGSLVIPRLRLSTLVVEGVDDGQLRLGAGHIPGTSLPGRGGNVGIAGHRDTFFRPLRGIRKDDVITLTTFSGVFEYRVIDTEIVKPDDVWVLYPNGFETLTLVTCYPFTYVGPAPQRFIIRAERVLADARLH
jgi:sortase A